VWLSYLLIGSVRALLGATPRWIGSEPEDRQRIYFANHTSHIDTVAIWSAPALGAEAPPSEERNGGGADSPPRGR